VTGADLAVERESGWKQQDLHDCRHLASGLWVLFLGGERNVLCVTLTRRGWLTDEETLSTLRYADQAKQIKTNAVVRVGTWNWT
jgi:hypothetical protein